MLSYVSLIIITFWLYMSVASFKFLLIFCLQPNEKPAKVSKTETVMEKKEEKKEVKINEHEDCEYISDVLIFLYT